MLKKILNRLGWGGIVRKAAGSPEREAPGRGEDFPQYLAPDKGLPVASVRYLLQIESDLVRAIHQTLGLEPGKFDGLILPVLERYAAFVHLLPATETDHHSRAGGLLRHGMEVAYWAARASEGVVFVAGGTPLERKKLEPRWHAAVCLAGLLHDIGTPIANLTVGDARGRMRWNPCSESLTHWASRHHLPRYYVFWRPNGYGHREHFAGLAAAQVLTPQLSRWLTEPDVGIMGALMQAITEPAASTSQELRHPVVRLVKSADEHSCRKDLQAVHHHADRDDGVPMAERLFTAMQALLASGAWTINQRGARVWMTSHGLFVVWKPAVKDILQWLKHDRIPGLPRDPRILAEMLVARGLAVGYESEDDASQPYWPVAPALLDSPDDKPVTLDMLRIADARRLFESEPPAAVAARVGDGREPDLAVREEPAPAPSSPETPELGADSIGISPPVSRSAGTSPGSESSPIVMPPAGSPATHSTGPAASVDVRGDVLDQKGEAGRLLAAMARDIAANRRGWGEALARVGDRVLVRYPEGVSPYGEPARLLDALSEAGWLDLDPTAPFKKVRELNGIRGLVLASEPARYVLALATVAPRPELPAVPGHAAATVEPA